MKYLCLFIATLIVLPASAEQPRVLIIGDSISLGYTPDVKKLLGDSVTVVHNKGNAQHTSTGVKKIDSWLGDKQWDVIHFNWGLWDLCYRHPDSKVQGRRDKLRGTLTTSLPDYERNLELLVARLKHTRAKLIWANTTVVPKGEKRVGGSWVPDDDRSKTMLGAEQWGWLEDQLKQPAQFRIIVSSIQFIAEDAGQEAWANLPHERQRMIDLLKQTKANDVVFISGDRHWSELSVLPKTLDYPLFDLTCSSLNQVHTRGTPTRNRHRFLPQTFHKPNFGIISLDWSSPQPSVTMQIRDSEGNVQIEHRL